MTRTACPLPVIQLLDREMADKGDVDFDGLELIDMRLEIDVDTLVTYMEENSEFPGMTS